MKSPLTVHETNLSGLPLLHRGKVRDVYAIDADSLLIVATDRLSAFDVVLPDPIPGKGTMLNRISNFWFERTRHVVPNHLLAKPLEAVVPDAAERAPLVGRSVVARRLQALPIEAVVRGYLIGSGWKDYQATGEVCGIALPKGLRQAEQLPQILFTPASKAAVGDHDENISYAEVEKRDQSAARSAGEGHRHCAVPLCLGACGAARSHHRGHQIRVRPCARRRAHSDR